MTTTQAKITSMPFHIAFQDVEEAMQERIREYWAKKWPRVERMLKKVPPDQRQLRLVVRKHPRYYDVRAVLMLPTATIAAHEDRPTWTEALDEVRDELRRQLVAHKERAWEHGRHRRKRERAASFAGAQGMLEALHEAGMREALMETLRPILRSLREYARHELTLMQLEGAIAPGTVTVGDVLDEVVVRAVDRWRDRPRKIDLELWVTDLIHEVIDEIAEKQATERELMPVHVEETIPEDDPRYQVEVGWIQENMPFWEPDAVLRLEDVIPHPESPEPWECLDEAAQRQVVAQELSRTPRDLRRAIALVRYQGWSPEQVAQLFGEETADFVRRLEDAAADLLTRVLERARSLAKRLGIEEE